MQQEIRFCTTPDGVRIAYATAGQGPPLVKTANWLNHLEFDFESPIWRHVIRALSTDHKLVRYDERGNGLSDWNVDELSVDRFVDDLETVVDALGLDRFPLFGISQGCPVSIAYAVKYPERVSCMILHGGYARGKYRRGNAKEEEELRAMLTLTSQSWGKNLASFQQLWSVLFPPDGTPDELRAQTGIDSLEEIFVHLTIGSLYQDGEA